MEMETTALPAASGPAKSFQTLDRRQLIGTIIGLQLTLLLAALDNTIVGTAMPKIIGQLNGFDRYAWVTTAYLLTSTIGVPIFGKLSDIFGRKWIFLLGAIGFVVASALCGAAGDLPLGDGMTQLIVFRGLQGLAAGVIMGLTFTIIGDIFPPAERGKYQGLFSGVWGLASVFGPTLGGWIADGPGWRWVFYVNLPVGIAAVAVLFFAFPDIRPQGVRRAIDWLGVGTLTACLVPLLLALTWVSDYGWTSGRVLSLLVLAAVMLPVFLFAESRAAEPILPLSLFRNRLISVSFISVFLTGMGMFGAILFVPLFMQTVIGVSATRSGTLLTPMMITMTFASIISGQLIARLGRYKIMAFVGLALMTLGMFLMSTMDATTGQVEVIRNMIVVGFGLGLVMPLYTLIVQNAVTQREMGVATSATQFFRSIGGTVGAAIFGSIMLARYQSAFDAGVPTTVPSQALAPVLPFFRNPLRLNQVLPQLQQQLAALPNGQQVLDLLMGNVKASLVHALGGVFLLGAALVGIGMLTNILLPEIALRKTFGPAAEAPAAEKPATSQAASAAIPALSATEGDD